MRLAAIADGSDRDRQTDCLRVCRTSHALHEKVAAFYERLGFRRIPDSLLLVQKIADIATAQDQD